MAKRVLSIDLAYKKYKDFGICLLEAYDNGLSDVHFLTPDELGLGGTPDSERCASALASFCKHEGVKLLMLDGPQGWKLPNNGCEHSRVCERMLNTQGKTGPPGICKPSGFIGYINF
ncbi:hypothetical protein [Thermincola potens]|uniref:hypothetical protein n=1 Tax=Thermincola potens TaxID=863643 RepID=UPI000673F3B5|nr:hypothetical protein [Thermincola potens]